ncbi:unnamed protein product [Arctia plantaginis]|uniref:Uncharacterized protein n=1 Tax=Arctia plantaginis TaxID=874455 RepID=A0A8S1BEG5_ARCPL|nr:unnamed protein product [Arctia plantaginis]
MFRLILTLYYVIIVESSNVTKNDIQVESKTEDKQDSGPSLTILETRSTSFYPERKAIFLESDDVDSSEFDSDSYNDDKKRYNDSLYDLSTSPIILTEKPSKRHKILSRHHERQKNNQRPSPYNIPDDNSGDEKYYTVHSVETPKKIYERADSGYSDAISSSDEEDTSFPKGFTQPFKENDEKYIEKTKRKKKSQYTTQEESDSASELNENDKNKKRHKNIERDHNHKRNKVKYKGNPHDSDDRYKKPERLLNSAKNSSTKPKHLENKNRMENITKITANEINKHRNKTNNFMEVRVDLSQVKNKLNNLLRNVNFDDFYSTPAVLPPNNPKISTEMPKVLRNLQNVKNDTKVELANLFKDLNQESQRIKDNDTINSFTKYILQSTLKLFDNMKDKSTEYRWKKKMKHLAKSYEDRFNEFLRATKHHTIRTRLGTRKVILNAIDVSKRMVNRLINFMANDMEKRGLVYNNLTLVMFRAEIDTEEANELKRACKKLDICQAQKGFTNFITDMLLKMLTAPNDKFKTAFDAIIESARKTDFALNKSVDEGIKKKIDYCGRQNVNVQRGMIMIVSNMIIYRNTPLIVYDDSNPSDSKLKSNLSFLEIINTFDENVPNNQNNIQEWDSLNREMEEWVQGRNGNVQNIMTRFMSHISNVIKEIDSKAWDLILQNAEILFL